MTTEVRETLTLDGRTFHGMGFAYRQPDGSYSVTVRVREFAETSARYPDYGVIHWDGERCWLVGLADRPHRVSYRTVRAGTRDLTLAALVECAFKTTRPDRMRALTEQTVR